LVDLFELELMHRLIKQDYSKINLSQCHCTLQTLCGLACDLRVMPATNHLCHDTAISYDPLLQKLYGTPMKLVQLSW